MSAKKKVGMFRSRKKDKATIFSINSMPAVTQWEISQAAKWIKENIVSFIHSMSQMLNINSFSDIVIYLFPGIPSKLIEEHVRGRSKTYIMNWLTNCAAISQAYTQRAPGRFDYTPSALNILKRADLRWDTIDFKLKPRDNLLNFLQITSGLSLDVADISSSIQDENSKTKLTLHVLLGDKTCEDTSFRDVMLEACNGYNFYSLYATISGDPTYWIHYLGDTNHLGHVEPLDPYKAINTSTFHKIFPFMLFSENLPLEIQGHTEYNSRMIRQGFGEYSDRLVDVHGEFFPIGDRFVPRSITPLSRITWSFKDQLDYIDSMPYNSFVGENSLLRLSRRNKFHVYSTELCTAFHIFGKGNTITVDTLRKSSFVNIVDAHYPNASALDLDNILSDAGWRGSSRLISDACLYLPSGCNNGSEDGFRGFVPLGFHGRNSYSMHLLCNDREALVESLSMLDKNASSYELVMTIAEHVTLCIGGEALSDIFKEDDEDELSMAPLFSDFLNNVLGMNTEVKHIRSTLGENVSLPLDGWDASGKYMERVILDTNVTLKSYIEKMEGIRKKIVNSMYNTLKCEYFRLGSRVFTERYECVYRSASDSFVARSYSYKNLGSKLSRNTNFATISYQK